MPSLCGRSPHEGVGKTSSRGQGWNAALSLETILHAAPVRWFPQVVFTHAVQLDTIGNTYRGAATNGITGRFQSVHRGIVDVSLRFDGFNLLIVCLATLVEVWSVAIFAHGPCTPLLMRDDHAPRSR